MESLKDTSLQHHLQKAKNPARESGVFQSLFESAYSSRLSGISLVMSSAGGAAANTSS
jgi:hypothetical protein